MIDMSVHIEHAAIEVQKTPALLLYLFTIGIDRRC